MCGVYVIREEQYEGRNRGPESNGGWSVFSYMLPSGAVGPFNLADLADGLSWR